MQMEDIGLDTLPTDSPFIQGELCSYGIALERRVVFQEKKLPPRCGKFGENLGVYDIHIYIYVYNIYI